MELGVEELGPPVVAARCALRPFTMAAALRTAPPLCGLQADDEEEGRWVTSRTAGDAASSPSPAASDGGSRHASHCSWRERGDAHRGAGAGWVQHSAARLFCDAVAAQHTNAGTMRY